MCVQCAVICLEQDCRRFCVQCVLDLPQNGTNLGPFQIRFPKKSPFGADMTHFGSKPDIPVSNNPLTTKRLNEPGITLDRDARTSYNNNKNRIIKKSKHEKKQ